jgi:flagellar hook-length control protein FliK
MEVNVLIPLSNSTVETAANPREHAENSFLGCFFAQIDQIWNQTMATDDGLEAKPPGPDETEAEKDPPAIALGVLPMPGNPQPPVLPQGLPRDFSPQLQPAAPSIQTEELPGVPARPSEKTSVTASFASEAEKLFDVSELLKSETASTGIFDREVKPPVIAPVKTLLDPMAVDTFPSENPGPGSENPQPFSQISASMRVLAPPTASTTGGAAETGQETAPVAQAGLDHSQSFPKREEVGAAAEKVGLPDYFRISADSDKSGEAIPPVVQANPGTPVTRIVLENTGTDNSRANGENRGHESISWAVRQNHPSDVKQDSARALSSIVERQDDAVSRFSASPARLPDASAPAITGGAEVAATKPRDFILQLADQIQVQLRDGKEEIRIHLKPDSLGHLEIRAQSSVNGLVARIAAESSSIKDYLETNLHLLQQSMQDQGLKVDRIQVSVQDNNAFSSFTGFAAQSGHAGTGHHGRGNGHSGAPGLLGMEQAEELVVDPLTWLALNPNIRFHTIA